MGETPEPWRGAMIVANRQSQLRNRGRDIQIPPPALSLSPDGQAHNDPYSINTQQNSLSEWQTLQSQGLPPEQSRGASGRQ